MVKKQLTKARKQGLKSKGNFKIINKKMECFKMAIRAAAALREREAKVAAAKEGLGNFKSLAQKEALKKNSKKWNENQKTIAKIRTKKVVKEYLKTNNLKSTAKNIGISEAAASRYLKTEDGARSLAEAFEKAGLGKEEIARIAKDEFLNYNKEKVVRSYGEGMNAREVEEMRDGRLAFNSLQFAAKYIEADANTIATAGAGEITSDVAMLAIKNLIQKLDEKQLRVVKESVEALLEKNLKIINEA